MRRRWLALALAVAACRAPEDAGRSAEAPEDPAPAPAVDDPVARWAAQMPDTLRHRAGACPFECCVYGTWTPTGEVPLRPAPDRAAPPALTIPAGEAFRADSGFVRIAGVSLLAVADTVNVDQATFVPGDTLVVLDYVGEGYFNVWDGDRVHQVTGFWGAESPDPRAELIGGDRYAREWWVHATTEAGRTGWLDADSVPRLKGADACGG